MVAIYSAWPQHDRLTSPPAPWAGVGPPRNTAMTASGSTNPVIHLGGPRPASLVGSVDEILDNRRDLIGACDQPQMSIVEDVQLCAWQ